MSVLAGFDACLEIDSAVILSLLRSTSGGPISLTVPSEVNILIPDPTSMDPMHSTDGTLHAVVAGVQVTPRASDQRIVLTVELVRVSIVGNSTLDREHFDASAMTATLTIPIGIVLAPNPMDATRRSIQLELAEPGAPPGVVLTAPHLTAAQVSTLTLLLRVGLQDVLSRAGTISVPVPVVVNPAATGSLSPPVATDMQLAISNAGGVDALVLFLNFFPGPHGSIADHDATALTAGHDSATSISPAVFHELLFCPAVATALSVTSPTLLPATCGESESVPYPPSPDISITHVEDSLIEGGIGLFVHLRKVSDGDATLQIDVHGHFTFEDGAASPHWHTDSSGGGIDFGWAYWLVGIIFLAPLGVMAILDGVVNGVVAGFNLGFTPSISLPGSIIPTVTGDAVDIHSDRFTLLQDTAFVIPVPVPAPTVSVSASVQRNGEVISRNQNFDSNFCPVGSFTCTDVRQPQTAVVTASAHWESEPTQSQWSVSVLGDTPVPLAGPSGEFVLTLGVTTLAAPPSTASAPTEVHFTYEMTTAESSSHEDFQISITPTDNDGNFTFWLGCTTTDAEGHVASDFTYVRFVQQSRTFDMAWQRGLADCADRIHQHLGPPWFVPNSGYSPGDPSPEGLFADPVVLAEFIKQAVQSGTQGQSVLGQMQVTYGARIDESLRRGVPASAADAHLAPGATLSFASPSLGKELFTLGEKK